MGCSKNYIMYWGFTRRILAQTIAEVCPNMHNFLKVNCACCTNKLPFLYSEQYCVRQPSFQISYMQNSLILEAKFFPGGKSSAAVNALSLST